MGRWVRVTGWPVMGRPEPGVWCDRCALPSGFRFTLHVLVDPPTGPAVVPAGAGRGCPECGRIVWDR